MKNNCVICGCREFGFTHKAHGFLFSKEKMESLRGICFDCYGLKPSHIPDSQVKKWLKLIVTLNGNLKGGKDGKTNR